jgi:hypothetical protein
MSGVIVRAQVAIRNRTCHKCGGVIHAGERCLSATQWRTSANVCKTCLGTLFSCVLNIPQEDLWSKLNR